MAQDHVRHGALTIGVGGNGDGVKWRRDAVIFEQCVGQQPFLVAAKFDSNGIAVFEKELRKICDFFLTFDFNDNRSFERRA